MRLRGLVLALGAVIALLAGCGVVAIERGDMTDGMHTLTDEQAEHSREEHSANAGAAQPAVHTLD